MKQLAIASLIGCTLFLGSVNVFADVQCPDIGTIKNVHFSSAKLVEGTTHEWSLTSGNFASHDGTKWNLWYRDKFPEARNAQEAIEQGQVRFGAAALRNAKPDELNPPIIVCEYENPPSRGGDPMIIAVNPPQSQINSFQK